MNLILRSSKIQFIPKSRAQHVSIRLIPSLPQKFFHKYNSENYDMLPLITPLAPMTLKNVAAWELRN